MIQDLYTNQQMLFDRISRPGMPGRVATGARPSIRLQPWIQTMSLDRLGAGGLTPSGAYAGAPNGRGRAAITTTGRIRAVPPPRRQPLPRSRKGSCLQRRTGPGPRQVESLAPSPESAAGHAGDTYVPQKPLKNSPVPRDRTGFARPTPLARIIHHGIVARSQLARKIWQTPGAARRRRAAAR